MIIYDNLKIGDTVLVLYDKKSKSDVIGTYDHIITKNEYSGNKILNSSNGYNLPFTNNEIAGDIGTIIGSTSDQLLESNNIINYNLNKGDLYKYNYTTAALVANFKVGFIIPIGYYVEVIFTEIQTKIAGNNAENFTLVTALSGGSYDFSDGTLVSLKNPNTLINKDSVVEVYDDVITTGIATKITRLNQVYTSSTTQTIGAGQHADNRSQYIVSPGKVVINIVSTTVLLDNVSFRLEFIERKILDL